MPQENGADVTPGFAKMDLATQSPLIGGGRPERERNPCRPGQCRPSHLDLGLGLGRRTSQGRRTVKGIGQLPLRDEKKNQGRIILNKNKIKPPKRIGESRGGTTVASCALSNFTSRPEMHPISEQCSAIFKGLCCLFVSIRRAMALQAQNGLYWRQGGYRQRHVRAMILAVLSSHREVVFPPCGHWPSDGRQPAASSSGGRTGACQGGRNRSPRAVRGRLVPMTERALDQTGEPEKWASNDDI
jgi:hypothetical protein